MPRNTPAASTVERRPHPHRARAAPRRAVDVDPVLKAANLRHLRRIEGQVRGIAAMIEDRRSCAEIIVQVAAVRESLLSVARNLMRNHLTHCATAAMQGEARQRRAMTEEILHLVDRLSH